MKVSIGKKTYLCTLFFNQVYYQQQNQIEKHYG